MSPDAGIGTGSKVSRGTTGCDVCQDRWGNVGRGSAIDQACCAHTPRPAARGRARAVVGSACTLVGLLDVAAGVFPRFRHSRMHAIAEVLPGALGPFAAALAISTGMLLLLLAHGLKRAQAPGLARRRGAAAGRRRRAVRATATPHRRGHLAGAAGAAAAPPRVNSRPCPTRAAAGGRWPTSCSWAPVRFGLGLVIVSAHPSRMVGNPSLADRIEHVLYGLFGFEGPVDYAGDTSWTVAYSLGALGLLTAVTTIYLAFRPEHPAAHLTTEDEERLRALLDKHGGRDSLGHFALRRDKAVVFSPSGKAAVTLPRRLRGDARQRRPDRRRRGLARRHRALHGRGQGPLLDARRHGLLARPAARCGPARPAWTPWNWATRRWWTSQISPWPGARCATCARWSSASSGPATRPGYGGSVTSARRSWSAIRRAAEDWRGTDTERGFSMALGRDRRPGRRRLR